MSASSCRSSRRCWPRSASDRSRTAVFAVYSLVGSLVAAAGSLAAAAAGAVARGAAAEPRDRAPGDVRALRAARARRRTTSTAACRRASTVAAARPRQPLGPSRRIVFTLAALFSLDAFGGGFVVQSLLALWLFDRFGLSLAAAGTIFFWTGLCSAVLLSRGGAHRAARSASSTRWCSRICRRTSCSSSRPSRRTCGWRWRCCWCAARSRRWTCRRAPPT